MTPRAQERDVSEQENAGLSPITDADVERACIDHSIAEVDLGLDWAGQLRHVLTKFLEHRAALSKEADAVTADLLKALHALREEMVGVDQWWGDLRQAVDAADEAISRAEGRAP